MSRIPTTAEAYEKAMSIFNSGTTDSLELSQAREDLLRAGNHEHAQAQYQLYLNFKYGYYGESRNVEKAQEWLNTSVYHGCLEAQLEKIEICIVGDEKLQVHADCERADVLLTTVVRNNVNVFETMPFSEPTVLTYVGHCIEDGLCGFQENLPLALEYYHSAAEQDFLPAVFKLALHYYGVGGLEQSPENKNFAIEKLYWLVEAHNYLPAENFLRDIMLPFVNEWMANLVLDYLSSEFTGCTIEFVNALFQQSLAYRTEIVNELMESFFVHKIRITVEELDNLRTHILNPNAPTLVLEKSSFMSVYGSWIISKLRVSIANDDKEEEIVIVPVAPR